MTAAALQPATRRRDPDVVMITLRLTQRQVTLLYGWAYLAHAFGTRITGTAAAHDGDAAAVLHSLTCVLYAGLYNATVRSGL